jgi:hypothetical protein
MLMNVSKKVELIANLAIIVVACLLWDSARQELLVH